MTSDLSATPVSGTPDLPAGLSPAPIMELITGFWSAKTLAAAVELDLFTRVEEAGGLTRQEAAASLGIEDRPADLFLAACAALGLLDKRGDAYVNTPLAGAFLIPDRPYYFGGFVRFLDHREYRAWEGLVTALQNNRPTTWNPDARGGLFEAEDPVMLSLFWEAMHSLSMFTGRALARALPELSTRGAILDVGGGSGAIPIEICRAFPRLRATIYDLPFVCEIAEQKVKSAGLADRISTAPGDFLVDDELPPGHDTVVLSSILHDWDESTGRALLRKCFGALPHGGLLVISEIVLNDERTGPPQAALMGMNMLIETLGGKNYSGSEYRSWLTDAGFTGADLIPCEAAGTNGLILARKP